MMKANKAFRLMPCAMAVALALMVGLAAGTWLGVLTTLKHGEEAREAYKGAEIKCPLLPPSTN